MKTFINYKNKKADLHTPQKGYTLEDKQLVLKYTKVPVCTYVFMYVQLYVHILTWFSYAYVCIMCAYSTLQKVSTKFTNFHK